MSWERNTNFILLKFLFIFVYPIILKKLKYFWYISTFKIFTQHPRLAIHHLPLFSNSPKMWFYIFGALFLGGIIYAMMPTEEQRIARDALAQYNTECINKANLDASGINYPQRSNTCGKLPSYVDLGLRMTGREPTLYERKVDRALYKLRYGIE